MTMVPPQLGQRQKRARVLGGGCRLIYLWLRYQAEKLRAER